MDTENPHSRAEWCQLEARSAIEGAEKADSLLECEGLLEIATSWLKLAQEYRESAALRRRPRRGVPVDAF